MTPNLRNIFISALILWIFPSASLANLPENSMVLEVRKGDTLSAILNSSGVPITDVANAINALKKVYRPHNLRIGQKVNISLDINDDQGRDLRLNSLSIKISALQNAVVSRNSKGQFHAKKISRPLHIRLIKAGGIIKKTLFTTALQEGIPTDIMMKLISNYSYDVDFQRDIQKNDSFEVLYERYYDDDGDTAKSGKIIFSSLKTRGREIAMYYYKLGNGEEGYYDENGKSIKKSFLKTPVDGARITSSFGRRKHPVLGYTKMHKGMDFGAARGTPIYAAADGIIMESRRKGSYGKYVKIRHANGYSTAYAHLKGYARGIKKGRRVKQGKVIGYVGTTGRSTGPHLHYELIKNGRQINPLSVKSVAGKQLKSLQLGIFTQYLYMINRKIVELDSQKLLAAN